MTVTAGGRVLGDVAVILHSDVVPRTVKNFQSLCDAENGPGLSYAGAPFHRIIPGFMAQGGDFTLGNGRGGKR